MKKLSYFLLTILLLLLLTGCEGNAIPLTEEESDAIAQYCAHLIMKYDKSGLEKEKLLDEREFYDALAEIAAREAELNPVSTPVPTAAPTEAPTPVPTLVPTEEPDDIPGETDIPDSADNNDVDTDITDLPDPSGDDNSGDDIVVTPTPEVKNNVTDNLNDLINEDVFTITCVNSFITKEFKNEGEYFSLTAPAGQQILVVEFDITNNTSENQKYSASAYKFDFRVITEQGKQIYSEISLLADDIQFLDDNIASGATKKALVIFFTNSGEDTFTLRVTGGNSVENSDMTCEITLHN